MLFLFKTLVLLWINKKCSNLREKLGRMDTW